MSKSKFNLLLFLPSAALLLASCATPSTAASTATTESAATLPAATTALPRETFSDPFAYCAAVGQIDTPDARYTGLQMTDALFKDYLTAAGLDANKDYPDTFKQMTIWRCMDNKVYACNFGANIPCNSKADTDKAPAQATVDYCKQFPDSSFIPMSVTGHSVIYSWHCVKGKPEILDQIDTVDAAGYQSSFWQLMEPVPYNPDVTVTLSGGGTGQIVFYSNRDAGTNNIYILDVSGTGPIRLTQGDANYFSGPFSPDGTRLLFTGFGLTHSYVGVMNADGSDPANLTNRSGSDDAFPTWSADGSQIAFTTRRDGNNEIYVMNPEGNQIKRLTSSPHDDFAPAWSPDGKQIAFVSDRDNATGIYSIYLMNADGSGVKRLTNDKGNDYTPAWSPDGSQIAFRSVQNGQSDIYVIQSDGSGMVNLTNHPAEDWSPGWSPDGTQIAFQSNRDGNWEIYTMQAGGADPVNLTNNQADDQMPFWMK
jgi:Tol biopolymer transport system component